MPFLLRRLVPLSAVFYPKTWCGLQTIGQQQQLHPNHPHPSVSLVYRFSSCKFIRLPRNSRNKTDAVWDNFVTHMFIRNAYKYKSIYTHVNMYMYKEKRNEFPPPQIHTIIGVKHLVKTVSGSCRFRYFRFPLRSHICDNLCGSALLMLRIAQGG